MSFFQSFFLNFCGSCRARVIERENYTLGCQSLHTQDCKLGCKYAKTTDYMHVALTAWLLQTTQHTNTWPPLCACSVGCFLFLIRCLCSWHSCLVVNATEFLLQPHTHPTVMQYKMTCFKFFKCWGFKSCKVKRGKVVLLGLSRKSNKLRDMLKLNILLSTLQTEWFVVGVGGVSQLTEA